MSFALRRPGFGEPMPLFTAATSANPAYDIGVAGGRWIVLQVFGSLSNSACEQAHKSILARRDLFDDANAAFFGVSVDVADRDMRGLANSEPGLRYFWDFDQAVSRHFGLIGDGMLAPSIFLVDRALRIVEAQPIEATEIVLQRLVHEMALEGAAETAFAPVLSLPRILEPELCRQLIDHFETVGGIASGFAADIEGRTVDVHNSWLKRRRDVFLDEGALQNQLEARLRERLIPMVHRALGWRASEIERYVICRYGAEDQGFFSAHRDNATAGTAHRQFAVTMNLNADEYEGGDLRFPEYGPRLYRASTGGAIVFCCSLLHAVTPVTRGSRYAFVPFLYDESGVRIRRTNLAKVGEATGNRHMRRLEQRSRRQR
jgi:predicted 2-oxoglutarate/Fe(II)-dependent dioxygenase YbiX/peroxiredoxin